MGRNVTFAHLKCPKQKLRKVDGSGIEMMEMFCKHETVYKWINCKYIIYGTRLKQAFVDFYNGLLL